MPSSTGGKQIMPYKNLPLSFFLLLFLFFFSLNGVEGGHNRSAIT